MRAKLTSDAKKAAGVCRRKAFVAAFAAAICATSVMPQIPQAKEWPAAAPATVGLDAAALASLDADLATSKYGLVDSMLVIRCGKQVLEHSYARDYEKIYG